MYIYIYIYICIEIVGRRGLAEVQVVEAQPPNLNVMYM